MITDKQRTIAEQSIYGDLRIIDFENTYTEPQITKVMPILRPISDLTKEITHIGYNDNAPFIPMVKIVSAYGLNIDECTFNVREEYNHQIIEWTDSKDGCELSICIKPFLEGLYISATVYFNEIEDLKLASTPLLDLLHLLHFDTRNLIDTGNAISTNITNPYAVNNE